MQNKIVKKVVVKEHEPSSDDEPPLLIIKPGRNKNYTPHYIPAQNGQQAWSILPGLRSLEFMHQFFPDTTISEWCDWKWQLRNSIRSIKRLSDFINPAADEIFSGLENRSRLPIRITPYYMSLIDRNDPLQSIRRTVVPSFSELSTMNGESSDPLCEHNDSPVPNIVHRYPDRALFLVTGICSSYCRYCTRSHFVAKEERQQYGYKNMEPAFQYIQDHKEIRDVVVSGGDPLILSDASIDRILCRLRRIPHVEIVRIGTKVPVVLPQRITDGLISVFRKYHPLWMSIHFTHPYELTCEVKQACERLADAGMPLGSQTVLLKGINDSVEILKELYHGLLKIRVRPYYLYQCDPVPGSARYRTSVEKGIEIIRGLRGHTSGYAVPHFVIDAPGGGGKIPLLPEYFIGKEGNNVYLRNFEGITYVYPDPSE